MNKKNNAQTRAITLSQTFVTSVLVFLSVAVPFFLEKPQLLVGSAVNCLLILAALNIKEERNLLPVVLLPSLATLLRGLVFGPFTFFLVYMMPFIWMGNYVLVYGLRKINNKFLALMVGGVLKVSILFVVANFLVKLSILPKIFITSMGLFQLYTLILGSIAAALIQKIYIRK